MDKRIVHAGNAPCVFVADVHLSHEGPEHMETFLAWIESLADTETDLPPHVFLLGDLFDFWFPGIDSLHPAYRKAVDRLTALDERLSLHFAAGNRDFHLVPEFQARGIDALDGAFVVETGDGNRRLYASHGDELCIHDTGYQRYKRIIRSAPLLALARSLPPGLKRRIVRKMSAGSEAHIECTPGPELEVPEEVYRDLLTTYDKVIHGHTHPEEGIAEGREDARVVVLRPWQGPENSCRLPENPSDLSDLSD